MKNYGSLLGRVCLSAIFILAGYNKIMHFSSTASYMASHGLPMVEPLLFLTILVELGGGLMLLTGWKARFGALMLFLFIIPVSYFFHPFWHFSGAVAVNQMNHFMKNLSIMGGMLFVMANGPGPYSLGKS